VNKIDGRSKTIRELLSGVKYSIDYYQREYKWEARNITELLEDLEAKFLISYQKDHAPREVQNYARYFLGSIVICQNDGKQYIIDGQQRLTSLTLLLIYVHNLQQTVEQKAIRQVDVRPLIYSERFGEKSFNIDVAERTPALEALFQDRQLDTDGRPESVRTILVRYTDIDANFPDTLRGGALPFFIDWLVENVNLVEITAYSDDDAYTIFETMNDRGLSLTPTDMLKGYLLANIDDAHKEEASQVWKAHVSALGELGKGEQGKGEDDADCIKAWLRAKYARTTRDRRKDARNQDFEKIASSFHKWVRDEKMHLGLETSEDFRRFVTDRFARFSEHYERLRRAAMVLTPGMEYVFYNAANNFTLQFPLILAALRPEDDRDMVARKVRLVAGYLDLYIARRIWNFRTLGYSSIVYTMFQLILEIRDKGVSELAALLKLRATGPDQGFGTSPPFRLHQQNRYQVHYLLARITRYLEEQCGVESSFATYVARDIKKPFEVEHAWANTYGRYQNEFTNEYAFSEYRNHIGGLLLLPRGFNQSFGDKPYDTKLPHYYGQNLLARSLNPQCYQNNPSFLAFIQRSGLPFQAHLSFSKVDLDARQELCRRICEQIWDPSRLDRELIS